ncbi:poly(beta-D-mannuronate) O-acetylase [Asticcacaulis sp. AC460]|uniref:MBOAT family O-acyltransferase n=1 Tax=Asticcacaulis sp. AC460 TaxID=1282360 RepID=UPI0003C3F1BB|nr:MBOAT family protein [Asticcacaulis sp. AC460]ESQ90019.1 poly(beta-D-mannuronate) O-acetylase [Asticcacaulis sp. AC460]
MVFSSNIFIYLFLPLFLAAYYLTPGRWKNITIVLGSYVFYAWWRVDFLILLIVFTLWNYLIAIVIDKAATQRRRNLFLGVGVVINVLTLLYFKYMNFFVENWNLLAKQVAGTDPFVTHIILPIGISFFVFQAISYLVDVWRRDVEATTSLVDLAAFKAIFPQLIAGPVLRYKDLKDQFRGRVHTVDKFAEGVRRFIYGLATKILLADSVAPIADQLFGSPSPSLTQSWLGAVAYSLQLFFDFSGYSSMAIGLALMMGFVFIENFDNPYASRSITEFWRRWHISLSTWLRDYVYIPLGGNRKGEAKTYRNLILTMLIGGFWHGANWTFLLWGGLHGGVMALERRFNLAAKAQGTALKLLAWVATILIVLAGWVLFRAANLGEALTVYAGMLGFHGLAPADGWSVSLTQVTFLAIALTVVGLGVRQAWTGRGYVPARGSRLELFVLPLLLILSLTRLSASSFSPFLYFQF